MNELLREIEEDIRRERVQTLWKSFGRVAVGASVVVVLITIVTVIWQERSQSQATASTTQFIKGLDRLKLEDYKGAIEAFNALTEDEGSPYYGLAMLRRAEAERLGGNKDTAFATYKTLAAEGKGRNAPFTSLSGMLTASMSEMLPEPDEDAPFYYAEREWRAWQLVEQNKKKEAVEEFTRLRDDEGAPLATRERAKIVLEHMAPESAPAKENG